MTKNHVHFNIIQNLIKAARGGKKQTPDGKYVLLDITDMAHHMSLSTAAKSPPLLPVSLR